MLPELISNGLASLAGSRPLCQTVRMEFTAAGQPAHVPLRNRPSMRGGSATTRFKPISTTKQDDPDRRGSRRPAAHARPAYLAEGRIKRARSNGHAKGTRFDDHGQVVGAHFREHGFSHQIVEEFVSRQRSRGRASGQPGRRSCGSHPAPGPTSSKYSPISPAGWATRSRCRPFHPQKILKQAADKPEVHAVNYALLRSLETGGV